jgi:hypothetical protein
MPIDRLLKDSKLPPDDIERLSQAYTFTLCSLNLVDRNDPVTEIVARKVIEIDRAGTHDPRQIAKLATKQLGLPNF